MMQMNKLTACLVLLLLTLGGLVSCQQKNAFEESPKARYQSSVQDLSTLLTSAPNGWKMTYFSRCDSMLFTSVKRTIGDFDYRNRLGYGGHFFLLKFKPSGGLDVLAEYQDKEAKDIFKSSYSITQSTTTTLSFDSYTDLHSLVNERFQGTSNFVYQGQDMKGNLLFTTTTYSNQGHEYIRLERLSAEETWDDVFTKSKANRLFFERMINPQIRIRFGEKEYYRSDVYVKNLEGHAGKTNKAYVNETYAKRYYLFLYNRNKDVIVLSKNAYEALGSGYVGTEQGISFQPGIIFNKTLRFRDFKRVGDKFVAELVRVYDPRIRKEFVESKHLYPEGLELNYVAEIWDDKSKTNG